MTSATSVRRGSSAPTSITSRFQSPDAMKRTQQRLEATEKKLATTKDSLRRHKDMMARSRLTPDGYKKAVARQKELEKQVKHLGAEVKELKRFLTVA